MLVMQATPLQKISPDALKKAVSQTWMSEFELDDSRKPDADIASDAWLQDVSPRLSAAPPAGARGERLDRLERHEPRDRDGRGDREAARGSQEPAPGERFGGPEAHEDEAADHELDARDRRRIADEQARHDPRHVIRHRVVEHAPRGDRRRHEEPRALERRPAAEVAAHDPVVDARVRERVSI